jgi:hypothetical protein
MIFINFNVMGKRCKCILVGLFLFNTLSAHFNSEIPLMPFNIFVWVCYVCIQYTEKLRDKVFSYGEWILSFIKIRKARSRSVSRARSKTPFQRDQSEQPAKKVIKSGNINDDDDDDEELMELCAKEAQEIQKTLTTPKQPVRADTPMNTSRPMTPAMIRVMSTEGVSPDNRSATPFQPNSGRVQCQATTVKGLQCRNAAIVGQNKCRVHNY